MAESQFKPLRGVNDVLPPESWAFDHVQRVARDVLQRQGYAPVIAPIIERPSLFARTIGAETDIVNKEMYVFLDRSEEEVALRPELTAGVVRMVLDSELRQQLPLRLSYEGAAFRYERPQKGRQRQFHQVGVEMLGASSPAADVDAILSGWELLQALGVMQDVVLTLHTLGNQESRQRYIVALQDYLRRHVTKLSEHAARRVETNPLRVLDSKDERDRQIVNGAPKLVDLLDDESRGRFDMVQTLLTEAGVVFEIDPYLVRGLDYYNDVVFEFVAHRGLGTQNAVLSGGRYDRLSSMLGGPQIASVGWAAGIERLAMMITKSVPSVCVAAVVADDRSVADWQAAIMVVQRLRGLGYQAVLTVSEGMKKRMREADRMRAQTVVIVGERERALGVVSLKHLATGNAQDVAVDALLASPATYLGSPRDVMSLAGQTSQE